MTKAPIETPFQISVPQASLDLLQKKLNLTTFPDELPDSGWQYGAPLADIQRLAKRWKSGFDWRKHEAQLNAELPQYTRDVEVDGHGTLNIHYVHQKSTVHNSIPLLFVHGWPGSFLEVRKILPLLVNGGEDEPSFHVVAPSLPGFGFSEGPKTRGFSIPQFAEVCHKLMLDLGYNEYVTQGGDWGYAITRHLASAYGHKHVKAWHTNLIFGMSPPTLLSQPIPYLSQLVSPLTQFEKNIFKRVKWFQEEGQGYFYQQSGSPQTLGYGLADSPIGLLGWIWEKLHLLSDQYPWTDDEVLEWISIYWFSRAGHTASSRIYFEHYHTATLKGTTVPRSTIPMGVSYFPQEIAYARPSWVRATVGNLKFYEYHESGGHFAAHEKPGELVDDVKTMFRQGGVAYGVVAGKDGYCA